MIETTWLEKADQARRILRDLESVVVAFSGGVDSTLLLRLAHESLGDRCVALTAVSPSLSARERADAAQLAQSMRARHLEIEAHELDRPDYVANGVLRCYHCKNELFTHLTRLAGERGFAAVADGSNADDRGDYRPGRRAAHELGVISPLDEAGLTKDDVRELSRQAGRLKRESKRILSLLDDLEEQLD